MNTTTTPQANPFDTFAQRDDFLGFGYIGGRRNAIEATETGEWPISVLEDVAAADALIIATAEKAGWSEARLFDWANSKDGRWFADCAFGGWGIEKASTFLR